MLEILLIIVTLFFVLKLKSSFGVRTDDEENRKKAIDEFLRQKEAEMKEGNKNISPNVLVQNIKDKMEKKDKKDNVINITDIVKSNNEIVLDIPVSDEILKALKKINFNSNIFLKGVDRVVEMISDSFSNKDIETLKKILSEKIFSSFQLQINDLIKKNQILKSSLVSISSKKIDKIYLEKKQIFIEVLIKTEQINFIEDEKQEVVFGNKKQINNVLEKWTFKRSIESKDNFWLVENIDNVQ